MKKNLLLIFFFCALKCDMCVAQAGEWTWMKGLNGLNGTPVFGTLGVSDANNTPPALYEPAEFKDLQGKFWLFGGLRYGWTFYNTLWMYDEATNEWTWEGGSSSPNQPGVYGTKGVPSVSNQPGARGFGVPTWVDNDGLFWLFGGEGYDSQGSYGDMNDLWSYNVATAEWTWVSGSNTINQNGVYGIQGVADTANNPGCRHETSATWVSDDNSLWFFGGTGHNPGIFWNDLWKYDPSSDEWTWMSGSDSSNQLNNYGTIGVPSPSNHPGARYAYSKWRDSQNNFWLFGGYWYSTICYNDLWKYDSQTNEWTWMSGSNIINDPGTYTANCDSSIFNFPASRMENRACWKDNDGKFWLFGGINSSFAYNDLWYYDPSTNEWTWSSGSSSANPSAIYGVKGVPNANNHPAAYWGNVGWIDDSCQFWIFGGQNSPGIGNISNTLWKFIPGCGACTVAAQTSFNAADTRICEKFCTNFLDQSTNNPISWLWQFPGGDPSSSTDQNPSNICYNTPGTYNVTLITTNANGSDTLTLHNYITVYPTPPIPTITQVGYTLTSSAASSYQWQLNSTDILGATNQSYTIMQTGYYTVVVGDSNGCKNSTTVYILISGVDELNNDSGISIYPNPSSGSFMVEWLNSPDLIGMVDEVSISVVNTLGQKIFPAEESRSIGTTTDFSEGVHSDKVEIDLSNVARGVYFIEIKTKNEFIRKKLLIAD
ncbi:MAG TPA: kelch repeat-containing protein [Chitinophagales bacterium]|nr:kelch repeat-containing protein [Chitinophagales bacterium]